jgi:hypothetical protein
MASEVIQNDVNDTKADIFSLGLCLSQIFDIEENEYKNKFIDYIEFDFAGIHKKDFLFSENMKRIKQNQSS